MNAETYGLNIKDPKIREALSPLIEWDQIIYRTAREKFIDDMHTFLAKLEKSCTPRFSSVRDYLILKHLSKCEKL